MSFLKFIFLMKYDACNSINFEEKYEAGNVHICFHIH